MYGIKKNRKEQIMILGAKCCDELHTVQYGGSQERVIK